MNFKPIFYVTGILLLILSGAMFIPMVVDLSDRNPDWKVFAGSQIITAFIGFLLIFTNREKSFRMNLRETFLMTTVSWVSIAVFAAVPFCLADIDLGFPHGFFEAMSGITTTGSTVLADLDHLPRGILLWRALLQWLGGIGFLIIALAVLPLLQISGMQIFKTQSFEIEKILPSASQMAVYILFIYSGLTALCALLLHQAGMGFFDAVCHAMSTLATGGFSTHNASIGHFRNPLIDYIVIFFMLMGGIPFLLYMRMLRGDLLAVLRDSQVRALLGAVGFLACLLIAYLVFNTPYNLFDAVRLSLFAVVALITTTGFTTSDYTLWGPFAVAIAFFITPSGACSGSTSGGIKTFRWQILWSMVKLQLSRLITPSGVFQAYYNNKPVDLGVQNSVGLFFFMYTLTMVIGGMLLMLNGLDFVTAFSGAVTAVSNVGPGLGAHIGPAGSFAGMDSSSAWILSACMLLGRLEIFTVLVLLTRRFWRH